MEISESGTLFEFHEHGYRLAIILSIAFEGAAIVLLGAYLMGGRREWRAPRQVGRPLRPAMPAPDRQATHPHQSR